jgi:hypothetical protein
VYIVVIVGMAFGWDGVSSHLGRTGRATAGCMVGWMGQAPSEDMLTTRYLIMRNDSDADGL